MDEATLISAWITGLAIAAVLVAAAAALLIAIWLAARRILRLALETLQIVESIKQNTNSIWALEGTAEVGEQLLGGARSIRQHGARIAQTLQGADGQDQSSVA